MCNEREKQHGRERQVRFPFRAAVAALVLAGVAACDGGGGGGDTGPAEGTEALQGVVLDTSGTPLGGVPVEVPATGRVTTTEPDGGFTVRVPLDDPRLRVGDSRFTELRLRAALGGGPGVPVFARGEPAAAGAQAAAPDTTPLLAILFLERTEAAITLEVPAGRVAAATSVGDFVLLPEGTEVTYPAEAPEDAIHLAGLGADRVPVPFPGGRWTRLAFWVGPVDIRFRPRVPLLFPNTEGLPAGTEADWYELDERRGEWRRRGTVTASAGELFLEGAEISRGGLYAALPRAVFPATTLTGEIRGDGDKPLEGYRIAAPGGRAGMTGTDGIFQVEGAPARPGMSLQLVIVSAPRFRPEARLISIAGPGPGGITDLGRISVRSPLRAPVPPRLTYTPPPGATGQSELTRIRVRFDRPMDLGTLDLQVVRGISREQRGIRGTLAVRAAGGGTELEFLPESPLENGTFYTVFVPKEARDLEGNRVDPEEASSRFWVRDNPEDPADGRLRLHVIRPFQGRAWDSVEILGDNLVSARQEVRFGDMVASMDRWETDVDRRGRDRLLVTVPGGISGEVPVRVADADGNFPGSLPFLAAAEVEVLDHVAVPAEGSGALVVRGRGVHLGSSPRIVWNGVAGGSFVRVPESLECSEELGRECFELTLPGGVLAGCLHLEVAGWRTRGFLVFTLADVDAQPPAVTGASGVEGGVVPADGVVSVSFSEVLDRRSELRILVGGVEAEGVEQLFREVAEGGGQTVVDIVPPEGGFPVGDPLEVTAGSRVRDLAGNVLDQDPATEEREVYRLEATVGEPRGTGTP